MTAEHPERPTCPDCGKPAQAVLEVISIGTGTTVQHGSACFESIAEPGANWRVYVH